MSGNLKSVIGNVKELVIKIKTKRDFILRELDGRQCVDTRLMELLLNSFVDQILDGQDVKPEADIVANIRNYRQCSHPNAGSAADPELKKQIKHLETKLEIEKSDNQSLHRRLQTFGAKETDYKKLIKTLTERIEKYKANETKLNTRINELSSRSDADTSDQSIGERLRNGGHEELARRRISFQESPQKAEKPPEVPPIVPRVVPPVVPLVIAPEIPPEVPIDSDSDSDQEDQLIKMCLSSKPFIKMGTKINPTLIDVETDEETIDIEEEDNNTSNESNESVVVTERPTPSGQTNGNHRPMRADNSPKGKGPKYSVRHTERGCVCYECNTTGCDFMTLSLKHVRYHCRNECAGLQSPVCHMCNLSFASQPELDLHLSTEHIVNSRVSQPPPIAKTSPPDVRTATHGSRTRVMSDRCERQLRRNRKQTQLFAPVFPPKRVKREIF
ncbi:unnamed protein product [Medioppia subpectinata]|uniref:C2H2-type domain-containing protein n=1 Tax=Medioppia subpectinata TaxID=1979941 RepID=A0A7R9PVA8_9ACAR|nr:unnamed protein product [Medioppia subpectinata]CAG2102428.1 unnamed protein product [Medioppia subpectinata]